MNLLSVPKFKLYRQIGIYPYFYTLTKIDNLPEDFEIKKLYRINCYIEKNYPILLEENDIKINYNDLIKNYKNLSL